MTCLGGHVMICNASLLMSAGGEALVGSRTCSGRALLRVASLRVQHAPGRLDGARLCARARQLRARHAHLIYADTGAALGGLAGAHSHAPLWQRGDAAPSEAGEPRVRVGRNVPALQQLALLQVQHLNQIGVSGKRCEIVSPLGSCVRPFHEHVSLSPSRALMLGPRIVKVKKRMYRQVLAHSLSHSPSQPRYQHVYRSSARSITNQLRKRSTASCHVPMCRALWTAQCGCSAVAVSEQPRSLGAHLQEVADEHDQPAARAARRPAQRAGVQRAAGQQLGFAAGVQLVELEAAPMQPAPAIQACIQAAPADLRLLASLPCAEGRCGKSRLVAEYRLCQLISTSHRPSLCAHSSLHRLYSPSLLGEKAGQLLACALFPLRDKIVTPGYAK